MYSECFLHTSKTLQRNLFFSQGSNGAGKNEFVSQYIFYRLISPSNIKYEIIEELLAYTSFHICLFPSFFASIKLRF